ncbi:hypothetical protein FRB90_005969 [Tulasnella sp. 427]|nr:hypothetical protein FRB90_005969 [Tulasnella sp. 427]
METLLPFREIRNLPKEMLSYIFVASLPPYFSEDKEAEGHGPGRKLCASVCRLWHQVVQHTPEMWALFEVGVDPNPNKIRHQIALAKSVPLHIRISVALGSFECDRYEATTKETIAAIAEKAGQWESLDIKGTVPWHENLTALLPLSLSRLEVASVSVQALENWQHNILAPMHEQPIYSIHDQWKPIISAPNLRQLALAERASFVFKDCHQLTHLRLFKYATRWGAPRMEWPERFGESVALLGQNCPSLQSLTFDSDNIKNTHQGFTVDPPLSTTVWSPLPCLTTLVSRCSSLNVIRFFLRHLKIPSTFTLDITGLKLSWGGPSNYIFLRHAK